MEDSSGHGPWSGATTVTYEDLLHGQLLDTLRGRILTVISHCARCPFRAVTAEFVCPERICM